MSKTSPTAAFHHAPRRIGRRLLRSFAFSAGVIAAAAAGAFLASQVVAPLHAQLSADTTPARSSFPCDSDGVAVGYDLTYAPTLGAFAVDHVRVVGIDPSCDGGSLEVALDRSDGTALAGATAEATVSGTAMRLALAQPASAEAIGMVEVSLGGVTDSVTPPVTPTPPVSTPTPTTPSGITVASPPTFCATVSGIITATGTPGSCGAVAAPPRLAAATGTPAQAVAVVSWTHDSFADPVTVTLRVPPKSVVPNANFAAGTFVQLEVEDASGNAITQFPGVLALDFPVQPTNYVPLYSEDGIHWRTIPKLDSDALPDGQPDGYYLHDDGAITILTRHATVWTLAQPPSSVGRLNATSLPVRRVHLGWHAAKAGLGVRVYQVLRDGKLVATVRTTRTTVALGPARRATFRVRAVDQAGERGPLSAPVTAEARIVTAIGVPTAHRTSGAIVVSSWVQLAEPARLSVSVQTSEGRWVRVLRGSVVAGKHVGGGRIAIANAKRGYVRIVVRLAPGSLRPGFTGTLRVGATRPRVTTPPLAQRFTAPH